MMAVSCIWSIKAMAISLYQVVYFQHFQIGQGVLGLYAIEYLNRRLCRVGFKLPVIVLVCVFFLGGVCNQNRGNCLKVTFAVQERSWLFFKVNYSDITVSKIVHKDSSIVFMLPNVQIIIFIFYLKSLKCFCFFS